MNKEKVLNFELNCPIPINQYERVLLAHGGGGKLTNQLIEKMFFQTFDNELLRKEHDGAVINIGDKKIAFSTDSFVVNPIFFPGGDIGDLAVNGTVNDIVCCGAKPLYISLAFIIEEGLLMEELWRVVQSINKAAEKAGVKIVTGDTKVVDKGKGDKIYINTTGIGEVYPGVNISPANCMAGDVIIINGKIADHGIAIISKREGLAFETEIKSDTAALNKMMEDVYKNSKEVHVVRDPTRGGLASSLNEISKSANLGITLFEEDLPVSEDVKGACELLGFDPLYVANEGKMLVFVPENEAEKVLEIMKSNEYGKESTIIGKVTKNDPGIVKLKTTIGSTRIVDMISGEQLPRIC
ncbi:MAG: hydrogenase expression/formation protein HypE [Chlorobi bacterium]|nr:hydrogenase expression/formation protein HypE [Chlorobiota bacterium]